jgi:hypothetical protein
MTRYHIIGSRQAALGRKGAFIYFGMMYSLSLSMPQPKDRELHHRNHPLAFRFYLSPSSVQTLSHFT